MADVTIAFVWAASLLGAVAIPSLCALRAWRGWLDLRREEMLAQAEPRERDIGPAVRIEMANLKERLRKLEAIARGVDL